MTSLWGKASPLALCPVNRLWSMLSELIGSSRVGVVKNGLGCTKGSLIQVLVELYCRYSEYDLWHVQYVPHDI